jgi:hypothetical protein
MPLEININNAAFIGNFVSLVTPLTDKIGKKAF